MFVFLCRIEEKRRKFSDLVRMKAKSKKWDKAYINLFNIISSNVTSFHFSFGLRCKQYETEIFAQEWRLIFFIFLWSSFSFVFLTRNAHLLLDFVEYYAFDLSLFVIPSLSLFYWSYVNSSVSRHIVGVDYRRFYTV